MDIKKEEKYLFIVEGIVIVVLIIILCAAVYKLFNLSSVF